MEDSLYQQFRNQSLDQLKNLKPRDVVCFDHKDIEVNYTLVVRPNPRVIVELAKLYTKLKLIDPDQYYYPANDLHLTLIGKVLAQINS